MAETFDPIDYLHFAATRWKFAAVCVGAALASAALFCSLTPAQYTATATLLIEPPVASDARAGTAVSPIYLESLKSYEQFAASDSLFLKACTQFGLLSGDKPPAVESLKRKVLRVDKLKDTKVLQISVTLADPVKAQAVAQFLAERTSALNRSLALESDQKALGSLQAQLTAARAALTDARADQARLTAQQLPALSQEMRSLADVLRAVEQRSSEASVEVAELAAQPNGAADLAAARARQKQLDLEKGTLEKRIAEKSSALAAQDARSDATSTRLFSAENVYRDLERREADLSGSAGLRTEQLRIVDPGIVPQRSSYPNLMLTLAAALLLSVVAVVAWLTLQYGLALQKERWVRRELRVARSANR